jgi:hypothetical protein
MHHFRPDFLLFHDMYRSSYLESSLWLKTINFEIVTSINVNKLKVIDEFIEICLQKFSTMHIFKYSVFGTSQVIKYVETLNAPYLDISV